MFHQDCARLCAMQTEKSGSWVSDKFRAAIGLIFSLMFLAVGVNASSQTSEFPVSNAGSDRVISVQNVVTLDGTHSISPNGESLSYSWSILRAPENSSANIQTPLSPRPSFTPDLEGEYALQLIVTSASGESAEPDTVLLSTGNLAPVAHAGADRASVVGRSVYFDPEGTYDANGDRLSADWSILSFTPLATEQETEPEAPVSNNLVCPANTSEATGLFHVVSATSSQQNPQLAVGAPLAEGTQETGSNSATTYYGPITMDLTGNPSIFVPEGETIEVVLSSAWGTSARAEILMSADGETYTSLGTVGNGGSVYGAYESNILRYDDFVVPAGGVRFLQVSHQNSGVRADGVIYSTQCQSGSIAAEPVVEDEPNNSASLVEDDDGRFVFTAAVAGEYSVQLSVEDEQGAQSTDIVTIYVAPENTADSLSAINIGPVAHAGFSQLTAAGETYRLDGALSTDVNGDMLTYQWSILSKPADSFSFIENSSSAIAEFYPDTERTYVLQLEVTDAQGLKDYDTVVLAGDFIGPFAVSGGPDAGADGGINSQSALVAGTESLGGGAAGFKLAYDWSVLGLSAGSSEIENAAAVSTRIDFPEGVDEASTDTEAQAAIDFIAQYNLVVFGDVDSNVDTKGSALIGGDLFGNSATFGTQIPQGQNIDALSVAGNITGGAKNINNGGNVRLGGTVSSHLNLNGGGELINDAGLNVAAEQSALLGLSSRLAELAPNSTAQIPAPNGQHGPGRLNASPDENGVAVFDIADGNTLFGNDRVQQIEVNANGTETIIVNVGGTDIDFNRGNFVGAIKSDDLRRKIIWNFHEATDLYFERAFDGTLLAPKAHLFNRSDIRGSVIVDSLQARGPIALPSYTGTGLGFSQEIEPTEFALVQLSVSDTDNPSVAPSYSSLVLTTGNLRPVARIVQTGSQGGIKPGDEINFDGASSTDGNNDPLSYMWSILSKPEGSSVDLTDAAAANISITPDTAGLYIVQLRVSDGKLISRAVTFAIDASNTAPIAVAGSDQSVVKGELVSLNGSESSDADGDTLTYVWGITSKPEGSEAVLSDASSVSPEFVADLKGDYIVNLTVNDGIENSVSDEVTVTVENRLPVAAVSGPSSGFFGDIIMLSSSGSSDPDGDLLTFSWTLQTPEGSEADLNDPTDAMPLFNPDVAGIYTVTLIVNDGTDVSEPVNLQTDISAGNRAPVLENIGNKTVSLGSNLGLQLFANDPDGDNLFYAISPLPLPDGTAFDVNTGVFSFSPDSLLPEEFSVSFEVSDGELRDSETISISIDNLAETETTQYSGQVIDALTGQGIEGVLVQAVGQTARTDANGEFTLNDLMPGQLDIWIVGDENTDISESGQSYAPAQVSATLYENVNNQRSEPIRLSTVSGSGIVTSGEMLTISSSAFGVTLDVPADSILDMMTGESYSGQLSISSISPSQANALPPNIVPCQLFSLSPKTVRVTQALTLTLDNYDNLAPGEGVDVWVFNGRAFNIIGSGQVNETGSKVIAQLNGLDGGQLLALAPRAGQVRITSDQPGDIYTPGLLNEGNYSTSYTTQSYSSLGAERALTFVYNSTSASPAPIISSISTLDENRATPKSVSQMVRVGDANLSLQSSVKVPSSQSGGLEFSQSGTFDATALDSGTYPVNFISVNEYACSKVGTEVETEIVVNNETDSPIGTGWSIAEISRLVIDDMGRAQIISGNGSILEFSPEQALGSVRETFIADIQGDDAPLAIDVDNNGTLDIVVIDGATGELRFYINDGEGGLVEDVDLRVQVAVGVETAPRPAGGTADTSPLRAADLNNDGVPEFIIHSSRRLFIQVISRVGDSYEITENIRTFSQVRELQPADFDGDGFQDFAVVNGGGITLYLNDGTGHFPETERLSVGATDIAADDIDGDGRPDIVTLSLLTASVRFNEGNLSFRDVRTDFPGGSNRFLGQLIQTGDVDLDGDVDFVVSTSPNPSYFENLGNREFRRVTLTMPEGFGGVDNITLADVTGDGRLDVIADERTPQPRYAVFKNLAEGGFDLGEAALISHPIGESLVRDIDQDGFQDLISKSRFNLYVDFGQPPTDGNFNSPFGDFTTLIRNDDGTFSRRFTNGSVVTFNAQGLQTATIDRNGNETVYVYDSEDRLVTVRDPLGLETSLNYGANGNLDRVTDPAGRSSIFTQTASGSLIEIRDPEDQPTRYDYDEQRRLVSETSKRDLTTINSYGSGGRYTGSELADGTEIGLSVARTLGLPDLGEQTGEFVPLEDRMTTVTDGRGNVTETEVNEFGSPIRVVDSLGRETIYERNDRNLVVAVIQPSSVTLSGTLRMEMTYDGLGNLTSQTEAVGTSLERTTRTEYETEFSRPIKITDADGFETIMEYDAFGNRTRVIDPRGGEELMRYDERGRVLSLSDKNGNVTEFIYDNLSRLEFTTDASNIRQQFIRDDAGNIIETIDDVDGPEERSMSYVFDNLNRETSMTAADGGVTTYVYDGNDNVTSTTDPTGIVETRSYDSRDRLETINDPASGTTVFVYDEDSNILRMTDALGETTEFTYDAVDRLQSSIDAKGQLRAFAYDSRDNITAVTDARANITHMGYDELDRPTARTNPKGEQWDFAYDARDNRTSATKPDSVVLLSEYDELSRMTRIAGGDIERTYAYDPQSNLLAANDNLNGVNGPDLGFSYDQENRLETADVSNLFGGAAQNNRFTYAYDALDRRESMADSFGGNTAYAYDPVDRLTRVTTPQGEVFTTNYDLAGRMLGRAAPNTTVTTRAYEDDTGRLASQTHLQSQGAASDTAFNGFTYDYTDRGNIGEIAETGTLARTKRYSYDELERLTEVEVPDAPTEDESYTLDPEGNRLSSHLSDTGETDVANRLSGDDAYSYVYDLNGNLLTKTAKAGVSRPDWAYDYDDLDQLISVSRDGVEVERYRYDAFGRRSLIETANDNAVFERIAIVNDGSDRSIDLVQVTDGVGRTTTQIQNRYTHGGQVDEPLSLEVFEENGSFDQAYTYHADHLGSIRFVTDSLGEVVNTYEYDSYGRPGFEVEVVSQPFRYTGREWDQAAELYHYRARQYDPETGRFLQEDPIGMTFGLFDNIENVHNSFLNGTIGQSRSIENLGGLKNYNLNFYKYVENNPLTYVDYSGEISALSWVSKAKKSAVSLTKSLRFQAQRRLNILPKAKNTPNTLRNPTNGQFAGNAAAQEFRRAKTIEAIGKCLNDIGAGFQVFADTDKGLQISAPSGATLGQVIASRFCATAGLIAGFGAKSLS